MITAISNVSPSITSEIHQNSGVFFFPSSGLKDPTGGAGQRSHRSAGRETLQGTAGVAGDGDLGIFVFGKKGSLKYCSMDGCMDSMDFRI